MNLFIEKHQVLLQELLLKKVDFIVIGGYSIIFHGYARSTGGVDLWLRLCILVSSMKNKG